MRLLTDCVACGCVVVSAGDMVMVTHAGASAHGVFDCPLCGRVRTVRVAPGVCSALVAQGAVVVTHPSPRADGPLTLLHLAELQRLLADDDGLRRLADGAV